MPVFFWDKVFIVQLHATLAQLVEQLPRKEQVSSSILLGGSVLVCVSVYSFKFQNFFAILFGIEFGGALTGQFRKAKFAPLGVLMTTLMLINTSFNQANAEAFDPDRLDRPLGDVSVQISEPGTIFNYSQLRSYDHSLPMPRQGYQEINCTGLQDENCDIRNPDLMIWGRLLLPVCDSVILENCVESLDFRSNGSTVRADYKRQATGGSKFPANPAIDFFAAGSPLIYEVTGLAHGGGTSEYTLGVGATVWFNSDSSKFEIRDLNISVVPTSQEFSNVFKLDSMGSGANNACAYVDEGVCGVREDFPSDVSIGLVVRISKSVGGWFMGRLSDPEISVESISNSMNRLTVSAKPVEVPRFAISREEGDFSEYEKSLLSAAWGSYKGNSRGVWADETKAFKMLEYFRSEAKDRAAGTNSLWSLRTIKPGGGSKCLTDTSQVLGIVTTNAMVYSGGSPDFDAGYLSYQVAGTHFAPAGTDLNLGTYDLVMRSETARCLYGFTKAPLSATVAVVGSGDKNVATTIVSEKDGWLKLAAYGFTFSEKEIKVKLTQPYSKTLAKFYGPTKVLSSAQKAEIRAAVTKAKNNPKFICTGTYVSPSSKSTAIARARATCNYAKSLDKNHSYFAQAKQTSARSYDAKVFIVSK